MARLDGGTSIAGYTALHSGLPNAYLGGTLTISGNVRVAAGAYMAIGDDGTAIDASLHIRKSEPRFNRLTQMSPGGAVAADALNLMASRTSAGADQWWSWGVASGNVFQIAPGTNLSSSTLNLTSGRVGVNTSTPRYQLDVNGDIIASNWIRTVGNNGWYSESWGGGWSMTDSTWIRAYNSKGVMIEKNTAAISNTSYDDGNLELKTNDASHPRIGFHRSGYTATALYHNGLTGAQGVDYLRVRGSDGWDSALAFAGRKSAAQLNNATNLPSGIYENDGGGILNNDGTVFRAGWYHIYHSKHDSDGYSGQIAIGFSGGSGDGRLYSRHASGATWQPWQRVGNSMRTVLPVGTDLFET